MFLMIGCGNKEKDIKITKVNPFYGEMKIYISATGTVLPRNRLEIKPPIAGRIEKIYVYEGMRVKKGQILAKMSSLDRAALLDAARASGEENLNYWEEVYKPMPIVSPIDGEVIVKAVEEGQTISATETVFVISDRLIVKAYVDETDIGKIKINQKAIISLDAYPDIKVEGKVSHISYESETINNVTMYKIDVIPDNVPAVFRSGMSANIDFIEYYKPKALLIPVESVLRTPQGDFVLVEDTSSKEKTKTRKIICGVSDERNIEVISGLSTNDKVILKLRNFTLPAGSKETKSPFMSPQFRRRR